MNPILVYLDSNIIIDICDGCNNYLRDHIEGVVDKGTHLYPFSAEQLTEIASNSQPDRNEARFEYLSEISRNNYFVHSIYESGFRVESPRSVYKTITEVDLVPDIQKNYANHISYDQQKNLRYELGLDPKSLNNLNGGDLVRAINNALESYEYPAGVVAPRSLHELVNASRTHVIESFNKQWNELGTTEEHMMRNFDILSLFSLFETFGYWPDDKNEYNKGTRFPDSQHTYNASHFDILISRDKRLRKRAAAVYQILGISTISISESEFLNKPTR